MATATASAIPTSLQGDLIALTMMETKARRCMESANFYRQRIEERMPGASRLADDRRFLARAVKTHNRRAARVSNAVKA